MQAAISGGVVLVLVIAIAWITISKNAAIGERDNRISTLEAELIVAQRDLAISQGNVATTRSALERQNAALQALEAEGRIRDERGRAALAEARRQNEALLAQNQNLTNFQPRPGEDICSAADRMIQESLNAANR